MYNWRKYNDETKVDILRIRKQENLPWHSPPHFDGCGLYHLSASNYEHQNIIGKDIQRLNNFSELLLDFLPALGTLKAWCVLPNHYHLLMRIEDLKDAAKELGKLHGKISFDWNKEDNLQGRKCWHRIADRKIRNADHYYATLNYIHNNPVKHEYVKKWDEWSYSSAKQFLEEAGREQALRIWMQYPVFNYGKGWDD